MSRYFGLIKLGIIKSYIRRDCVEEILAIMEETPIDNKKSFIIGIMDTYTKEIVYVPDNLKGKEVSVRRIINRYLQEI